MSRSLGSRQRRLLVSIAAIAEAQERGADTFALLTLWSRLDGLPRQAVDRANLHRGLRTLVARGLVTATDHADYTARCVCHHTPAELGPAPDARRTGPGPRRRAGGTYRAVARHAPRGSGGARPPGGLDCLD